MAISVTVDSTTTLVTGGSLDWIGRPTVKKLASNRLVLVYYRATAHAANDGALYIKFSDDYGATWSAENALPDGTAVSAFPMNPPVTAGEDAFEPWLYLAPNGDLLLHMWRYNHPTSNGGSYQSRSTDGGATWTTPEGPIQFAGLTMSQNGKTYSTDDDFVVGNTIYAGARVYADADQDPSSLVFITSSDNGVSWTRLATVVFAADLGGHGTQEMGLEYLGNSTIVAMIRDTAAITHTYRSFSYDMGVTWTALEDITSEVGVTGRQRLRTRAHLKGEPNWWLDRVVIMTGFEHQTPGDPLDRRQAIWISTDLGENWSAPYYIDSADEDGGYSDFYYDPTQDQYVVIYYKGDYASPADLKMARLTISGIPSVPGVWVDWGNDGAFDDDTAADGRLARMLPEPRAVDDNITSDVVSIDWSYGGSADHVSATNPGTATIVVQNDDGKYSPDNTGSPLYGFLKPGRRVWIGLNEDGTVVAGAQDVYGIFAGYIRQIVPLVADGATAFAELICEDPLGAYVRRPAKVAAATDYSYRSLREAILDDIGEDLRDLASEPDTLPLAAADSDNALSVLEEINKATGSRHWANPADSKELWYSYTVRDRHHKLDEDVDDSINADDVQDMSGYRVTEENIVNYQSVDVSQAQFPAGISDVWVYAEATFPLTTKRTIWAQFDDFVKDATLDYSNTGDTVTAVLTNFGTTAKIELWSAGSSTVLNLSIEGRMVQRNSSEAVTAEDAASQLDYGTRSGGQVSSTYSSTPALAQGLADFLVWKYKQPLKRPGITQINEFPQALARDIYDTIAYTVDRLYVVDRRFEIIGISGRVDMAAVGAVSVSINWELQETPNQSALSLFRFNQSVFDGADLLAR